MAQTLDEFRYVVYKYLKERKKERMQSRLGERNEDRWCKMEKRMRYEKRKRILALGETRKLPMKYVRHSHTDMENR